MALKKERVCFARFRVSIKFSEIRADSALAEYSLCTLYETTAANGKKDKYVEEHCRQSVSTKNVKK